MFKIYSVHKSLVFYQRRLFKKKKNSLVSLFCVFPLVSKSLDIQWWAVHLRFCLFLPAHVLAGLCQASARKPITVDELHLATCCRCKQWGICPFVGP